MSTKLPILNAPRFNDNLPSTGEKFSYRPFLVKEEKYIQLTKDSDDVSVIYESLKSLISSCTSLENIDKLSLFDIEYIFLRLREKSVGDIVELKMKHIDVKDCDHVETVNLDLKNIRVQKYDDHSDILILDKESGIKVKMKYPEYKHVSILKNNSDFETLLDVLINCTEMVIHKEEIYLMKDFTNSEKKEFFLNFNLSHMEIVRKFFDTMPKICYDLEWTCSKCGKKESHTIEGVQSFLS